MLILFFQLPLALAGRLEIFSPHWALAKFLVWLKPFTFILYRPPAKAGGNSFFFFLPQIKRLKRIINRWKSLNLWQKFIYFSFTILTGPNNPAFSNGFPSNLNGAVVHVNLSSFGNF